MAAHKTDLPYWLCYLTDEGGVFKSKAKKQKASEVREDRKVREEVPIDKRKAEEVEVWFYNPSSSF